MAILDELHNYTSLCGKEEVVNLVCSRLEDDSDLVRERAWRVLEEIGYLEGANLDAVQVV